MNGQTFLQSHARKRLSSTKLRSGLDTRVPNLLSFKGVPSPPSWFFFCFLGGGIFTPLHQLRGYHYVFRAASPSQAMREDSKSYFECSIWSLTVWCAWLFTISKFSEPEDHNAWKHRVCNWADSMALLPRSHEWVPTFSGWRTAQNFRK